MGGCLRPAAGFYGGGGGVTPSPTPQVPEGSAYWRPVTLGGTVFKALVDSFGRLYTHEDEGVVSGFAWSAEGEQLPDFDNMGRYSEAFSSCYSNWGHNNKLVEFTGNTAIFEYDGQQIPLVYDELSGEITPNVPQMTNGRPDIFIRTLFDGSNLVKVLVTGDGTLLVHANSYFLVNSESGEITVEDDATKLAALTEAAGVAVTVDEFVEDTDGFFKIVNNGYTVIVNFDGYVTFGEVKPLFEPAVFYRAAAEGNVLVDIYGRVIVYDSQGGSNYDKAFTINNGSVTIVESSTISEIDTWGQTPVEITSADSVISFTLRDAVYTIPAAGGDITPSVSVWVPLTYWAAQTRLTDKYWACDSNGKFLAVATLDQQGQVVPGYYNVIEYHGSVAPSESTVLGWSVNSLKEWEHPEDLHIVPGKHSTAFLNGLDFIIDNLEISVSDDWDEPMSTTPMELA